MRTLELHYNVFMTIKAQLDEQGFTLKDIDLYEECKDDIIRLKFHGLLTECEKEKAIKRLHKKIANNVEVVIRKEDIKR